MKWFVKCIKNYANFNGRARRSEYWYFILFALVLMFFFCMADYVIFGLGGRRVFSTVFSLFIFLPQLAVMTRRLHDTGRSGKNVLWFYLAAIALCFLMFLLGDFGSYGGYGNFGDRFFANLLLVFGAAGALAILIWAIRFIVWFCKAGDKGPNKYGPDPKMEVE
ncbi:DUF805 domain-containing protein [uncultured Alistipes sp.]|jgi:hypothetical protein|uniref:DUF805 domain-containing protein n=1 Tax=uncultured Alistipes sp. TaxID=538949 RepID=UPI0025E71540|nr:DUF805 domain-containing protein [uncultured Alistipes sp.]